MLRRPLSLLGFVLAFTATTVSAQSGETPDDSQRVTLFTGGAFAGSAHVSGTILDLGKVSGSIDLAPTALLGVRYEGPIHRYFLLGGQFRAAFWGFSESASFSDGDRGQSMLDFDLTPKARYPVRVKQVALEPYLVVPLGFSLGIWKSNSTLAMLGADRANPGWNLGALAGLTLITHSGFGAMLELGVMHHAIYDENQKAATYTLAMTQFTLHAGVTYAF